MKKLRCGTEPAWELLRSDGNILASRLRKVKHLWIVKVCYFIRVHKNEL